MDSEAPRKTQDLMKKEVPGHGPMAQNPQLELATEVWREPGLWRNLATMMFFGSENGLFTMIYHDLSYIYHQYSSTHGPVSRENDDEPSNLGLFCS